MSLLSSRDPNVARESSPAASAVDEDVALTKEELAKQREEERRQRLLSKQAQAKEAERGWGRGAVDGGMFGLYDLTGRLDSLSQWRTRKASKQELAAALQREKAEIAAAQHEQAAHEETRAQLRTREGRWNRGDKDLKDLYDLEGKYDRDRYKQNPSLACSSPKRMGLKKGFGMEEKVDPAHPMSPRRLARRARELQSKLSRYTDAEFLDSGEDAGSAGVHGKQRRDPFRPALSSSAAATANPFISSSSSADKENRQSSSSVSAVSAVTAADQYHQRESEPSQPARADPRKDPRFKFLPKHEQARIRKEEGARDAREQQRRQLLDTLAANQAAMNAATQETKQFKETLKVLAGEYTEAEKQLKVLKREHEERAAIRDKERENNAVETGFYERKIADLRKTNKIKVIHMHAQAQRECDHANNTHNKALDAQREAMNEEEESLRRRVAALAAEAGQVKSQRRVALSALAESLRVKAMKVVHEMDAKFQRSESRLVEEAAVDLGRYEQMETRLVGTLTRQHNALMEETKQNYVDNAVPHKMMIVAKQDDLLALRHKMKLRERHVAALEGKGDELLGSLHHLRLTRQELGAQIATCEKEKELLHDVLADELVLQDEVARQKWENTVWMRQMEVVINQRDAMYKQMMALVSVLQQKRANLDRELSAKAQALMADVKVDNQQQAAASATPTAATATAPTSAVSASTQDSSEAAPSPRQQKPPVADSGDEKRSVQPASLSLSHSYTTSGDDQDVRQLMTDPPATTKGRYSSNFSTSDEFY